MAIVLAEVEASAADIHVPLEGSFAASSSVRHWAGFHPRHGKAHVWCCVPAPLSCYGADADLPGSIFFRQCRLLRSVPTEELEPVAQFTQPSLVKGESAPKRR